MPADVGAFFGGDVVQMGQSLDEDGEIGRVVVGWAVVDALVVEGRGHVGGIGFEQDAIQGDGGKGIQGLAFAGMQEIPGEGEIRATLDPRGNHGRGAAVAVQQEWGQWRCLLEASP